jgi:hypothetical protein
LYYVPEYHTYDDNNDDDLMSMTVVVVMMIVILMQYSAFKTSNTIKAI